MRWLGRTDIRVLLAILITALVPLAGSVLFARVIVARISATAFQPEFGAHLDRALTVYADLAKAMKDGLRHEAVAMASSAAARDSTFFSDDARRAAALASMAAARPRVASLAVERCGGEEAGSFQRATPPSPATERTFTVRLVLLPGADPEIADPGGEGPECDPGRSALRLAATFAVPRARFDELEEVTTFRQAYAELERNHREEYLDTTYRDALVALLAMTIAIGLGLALLVAAPVTSGIAALARATRPVAAGDLTVRVAVRGKGEVADLGRAFNRMLEELDHSRARMEFLRRVGEWQKVARRLAHEIKNPLTPIQLAVEECHRRYRGEDPEFAKILETTLEVVTEEVGSLRRLVTEFSGFARLPGAELAPGDLAKALAEERERFAALAGDGTARDEESALFARTTVRFELPASPMPVALDREMLHRAIGNVVKNAAQALRDARGSRADLGAQPWGVVIVTAHTEGSEHVVDVDDDGPGIPAEVRTTLFDPYVTTRRDGTGLGLTIVKKIVVDHGGTIEVLDAPSGGARIRMRFPALGTPASQAAAAARSPDLDATA